MASFDDDQANWLPSTTRPLIERSDVVEILDLLDGARVMSWEQDYTGYLQDGATTLEWTDRYEQSNLHHENWPGRHWRTGHVW
jgi:hypothetical protein